MQPIAPFKVLFLCNGNSARSIFGEFLLRQRGGAHFETYSAGANPRGEINSYTVRVLREAFGIDVAGTRPKSIAEFLGRKFDYVFTLCDEARETCPAWPDETVVAHWGSPDPAAFQGSEEATYRHFFAVANQIKRRIDLLCSLPLASLDHARRERLAREIGDQEMLPGQP